MENLGLFVRYLYIFFISCNYAISMLKRVLNNNYRYIKNVCCILDMINVMIYYIKII